MNLIKRIQPLVVSALVFGAGLFGLYGQDTQRRLIVTAITSNEFADLVAVNGGLQQGIERGMLLSVFHEGRKVGELLVTRSEAHSSVSLISEISPNQCLSVGDLVLPKVRTL